MSFYGLDDFRAELESRGFTIYPDNTRPDSQVCNWIACCRMDSAIHCETNDYKVQVVIKPFMLDHDGTVWESVQADITGERSGVWFKLMAYSMKPAEYLENMDKINGMLLAAWNNLENVK